MKVLIDTIKGLKRLHELKKNDVPMEKLFLILGKYLYTELPTIKGYIYFTWVYKNKVVEISYDTKLNINKEGEMWFDGCFAPRMTLSNIIKYLEAVLENAPSKYYSDVELEQLSVIIKKVSGAWKDY